MSDAPTPSLLAALAHPNDESRIVGGTLAKYAAEGVAVAVYCATRGEAWLTSADWGEQKALRTRELVATCQVLGIGDVRIGDYPHGRLDQIDQDRLVSDIAVYIVERRPQAVITFGPKGRTLHSDYLAIHHAATLAFAQLGAGGGGAPLARLFYTTVARRVGWGFLATPDEAIAISLDITPWLDRKREATVVAHASQYHDPPFANVGEATRWQTLMREDFVLAPGSLPLPPGVHDDLLAGLR